jgi:cell division transport system permease protein
MRALDYALRQGWITLWRSRAASAFAVAAIALALVVLGALLLVTWNARRVLADLSAAAEFSIYLQEGATSDERAEIERVVDQSGVAAAREYISKPQALARFRTEFADLAPIAADLDENPFPASIEVRVRTDADAARFDEMLRRVGAMPAVADVRYDREWLESLGGVLRTMNTAGLALVVVMALAAAITVAAVVRLGLQARHDEIEIMELVGAPLSFIRGPFVAEGLLQGGIGAALALIGLWVLFLAARAWWGADWTTALGGGAVEFLPLPLCALLLVGGMALGSAGGLVASRHAGSHM